MDGHAKGAKGVGITMAVLGVMLAVCAALVGAQRTDLIATMVAQSNAYGVHHGAITKLRTIEGDGELLHALTPSRAEVAKFDAKLKDVRSRSGAGDREDAAEMKEMIDVSTRALADVLSPDPDDEARFAALRSAYRRDADETGEDADAFGLRIEAHEKAAEGYERAQLCAEIGIVIASIALLLSSRKLWGLSLVIGVAGALILGTTFARTQSRLAAADRRIEEAAKNVAPVEDETPAK